MITYSTDMQGVKDKLIKSLLTVQASNQVTRSISQST
jgi:hypothetical protein